MQRVKRPKATLNQHVLLPQRFPSAILHRQHHRARLNSTYRVPLSSRDIDQNIGTIRRKLNGIRAYTLQFIIELLHYPTSHTDDSFRGLLVPMDSHGRTRLNGIQHPLRAIILRVPQVIVHPQPRRSLRLLSQTIQ